MGFHYLHENISFAREVGMSHIFLNVLVISIGLQSHGGLSILSVRLQWQGQ